MPESDARSVRQQSDSTSHTWGRAKPHGVPTGEHHQATYRSYRRTPPSHTAVLQTHTTKPHSGPTDTPPSQLRRDKKKAVVFQQKKLSSLKEKKKRHVMRILTLILRRIYFCEHRQFHKPTDQHTPATQLSAAHLQHGTH